MRKKRNYPAPVLRVVKFRVDTHLLAASLDSGINAKMSGYQSDEDGFTQD